MRRLRPLVAISVLISACAAPLALVPVTPLLASALSSHGRNSEAAKQIADLQVRGDWAGLVRLSQAHLQADPADSGQWTILGYAHLQQGRLPDAIDALSQVTRLNPEEIDGWNLLGEALRVSGKSDQAVRALRQAVSIDPSSPVSRFLLGETYRDQGRFDASLAAYRDAVELEPKLAPAWFGLGLVLLRTGQRNEFEKVLQVLRQLDSELAVKLASQK